MEVGSNVFYMEIYPTKGEVAVGVQQTSLGGDNRTSIHGNVRLPLDGSASVTREGGNMKNKGLFVGDASGSGEVGVEVERRGGIGATTEFRVEFRVRSAHGSEEMRSEDLDLGV